MKSTLNLVSFWLLLTIIYNQFSYGNSFLPKYSVSHGVDIELLSQVSIREIQQDDMGYMWFGTWEGLNRFDGYDVKVFRFQQGVASGLSDSKINVLLNTRHNGLLVGTSRGVQRYLPATETFEHLPIYDLSGEIQVNISVSSLWEDEFARLWIGTARNGITLLDRNRQPIAHFHDSNSELPSNRIAVLYTTSNRRLFIGTYNGIASAKLDNLSSPIQIEYNGLTEIEVMDFLEVGGEELLVATTVGLKKIDLIGNERRISVSSDSNSKSVYRTFVSKLERMNSPDLVAIGTWHQGVCIYQISTGQCSQILTENSGEANGLFSTTIESLFSKDNLLWIGTSEGVNKVNLTSIQLGHYLVSDEKQSCPQGKTIFTTVLGKNDRVWIGSPEAGLQHLDLKNHLCDTYTELALDGVTIDFRRINTLFREKSGKLWVGLDSGGLIIFDEQTEQFKRVKSISKDIWIDRIFVKNSLAIVSTDKGTFALDAKSGEIINQLNYKNSPLVSRFSMISNSGDILVGSARYGLLLFDSDFQFKDNLHEKYKLPTTRVEHVSEHSNNKFWFNTLGHGLFFIDLNRQQVEFFNVNNSLLLSNMVLHHQFDKNNHLWASTSKGITKFDFDSGVTTNFSRSDGLQHLTGTMTSDYRKEDDVIIFGGVNGFNYFSPTHIVPIQQAGNIGIVDLELHYQPVDLLKRKSLANDDNGFDMVLSHEQNVLMFKFSAFDFHSPKMQRYSFQLENYQNEWKEVDSSRRFAMYTNLDAGDYTFRVKATLSDPINDNSTTVRFRITPPWWQTPTAYSLAILLFLLTIYLFIKYRTYALKEKAHKLRCLVDERTLELADEKDKVENLLHHSYDELANVSHELRTPLTLILGPTTQLIETSQERPSDQRRLKIIERNATRLLTLVNQLLNIESFRVSEMANKRPIAVGKTINTITEAFQDLAKFRHINFTAPKVEPICFEFTPDGMEKIILNLLSNAFKFTKDGGSVGCNVSREGSELKIEVLDTGVGIKQEDHERIFQRFYRVQSESNEQIIGSGIGMTLVKRLVDSHHGTISLKSVIDQGTHITIVLPIVSEVSEDSIDDFSRSETISNEIQRLNQFTKAQPVDDNLLRQTETFENRVLIIDDNLDMQQYILDCLQSNYHCSFANNGLEGLEKAKQEIPDIIICDVMMPVMDGFDATEKLRENELTSHIPIILLTARGDKLSKMKGWRSTADEYLTKPFDNDELIIRVDCLLNIRNLLRKRFGENVFKNPSSPVIEQETESFNKTEQEFIHKLDQLLEQGYQDSAFGTAKVAEKLCISDRQLRRKLKSILDVSPTEYLRIYRLEQACRLLKSGIRPSVVCYDVGFSSHTYFGSCFKARYGCSPSEYVSNGEAGN